MQESAPFQGIRMTSSRREFAVAGRETAHVDERDLLLRHRDGDSKAFAGLVAGYRAPIYSYLVRCGVTETDRDDLFQEIFIKIHGAANRYNAEFRLHPWLFTIVANTVRTYHRKKKLRDLVFGGMARNEPRAAEASGERQAMVKQTVNWLEDEIPKLPLIQREVLILTCVENLPQKEVAGILEVPVNTVKTHLRRARLALGSRLARRNKPRNGEVPS